MTETDEETGTETGVGTESETGAETGTGIDVTPRMINLEIVTGMIDTPETGIG